MFPRSLPKGRALSGTEPGRTARQGAARSSHLLLPPAWPDRLLPTRAVLEGLRSGAWAEDLLPRWQQPALLPGWLETTRRLQLGITQRLNGCEEQKGPLRDGFFLFPEIFTANTELHQTYTCTDAVASKDSFSRTLHLTVDLQDSGANFLLLKTNH